MIRLVLLIVFLLAVGWASAWMVDHPGDLVINWQGWRVETSFAVVAVGMASALLVVAAVMALWGWARRDLPFLGSNRHLKRQRKGLEALNRAIVALAAGDAKEADRLVSRAGRLLPPQPMTHVIAAQAASLAGKKDVADKQYKALLKHPEAEFIGVRGLLTSAMRDGRDGEARTLADRALELEPKSPWALKTQVSLDVKKGHWSKAAETLATIRKLKAMQALELARLEGVVWFLQALEADLAHDHAGALKYLEKATAKREGFIPALVLMARLLGAQKKVSKARKILAKAWAKNPHPDLAASYLDLAPMDTPSEKLKLIKGLIKGNATHLESHVALARAEIAAAHGFDARQNAQLALHDEASERVYALLADAELAAGDEGSPVRAEEAKAKACTASGGAGWHCTSCGTKAKTWVPYCPECHEFDVLEWGGKTHGIASAHVDRATPLTLLTDTVNGQPPRPDA